MIPLVPSLEIRLIDVDDEKKARTDGKLCLVHASSELKKQFIRKSKKAICLTHASRTNSWSSTRFGVMKHSANVVIRCYHQIAFLWFFGLKEPCIPSYDFDTDQFEPLENEIVREDLLLFLS